MVKKVISSFIPSELVEELQKIAKEQKRTLSSIISEVLEDRFIKKEVEQNGMGSNKTI
jgi:predicted transcriptional regulator